MAYQSVLKFPDQVLRMKSEAVIVFDDELQNLVVDLHDTINVSGGIGLSAPQIGVRRRVIYISAGEFTGPMINPRIVDTSNPVMLNEGCLSFPGVMEDVNRFANIKCTYQDVEGVEHQLDVADLSAHIIQHEIEHLDGVLLIDKLSRIKRARIHRKAKKQRRVEKGMMACQDSSRRKKKNSNLSKKELKIRKKRRLRSR